MKFLLKSILVFSILLYPYYSHSQPVDREKLIKLQNINSQALAHLKMGNIEKAIENWLEALKIWEESPDKLQSRNGIF